ncbi:MAG: patatin-like phospholipase family protein [Solirubrobacteraceae bacterium]
MRIGLVLGAGGVLGGAWVVGALEALAAETGWDPGSADHIVGTSAGAMVGALCAAGVPPWFMLAHSLGETPAGDEGEEPADAEATRAAGAMYRLHRGMPSLGPGSWRLAAASLARPYRYSPAAVLAGWLPSGLVSTEPLKATVRRVAGDSWAPHPGLWIMACDYATGRRVAFGREDAPPASLADAVAASCAIPGFYRPVEIGGRRYVDGGVASTSNLDVLARVEPDLVICLNPTSSLHASQQRRPADRAAAALRQASGRRLGREARRVRAAGAEVVLIQPTVQDLDAMGTNLMSARRRNRVIEVAVRTVGRHLCQPEIRARLADLPPGVPDLVRRPPGQAAAQPDFAALAHRRRWAASPGAAAR